MKEPNKFCKANGKLGQKAYLKLAPCQAMCDATVGCNFISVSNAWCKLDAVCEMMDVGMKHKDGTPIWTVYQRYTAAAWQRKIAQRRWTVGAPNTLCDSGLKANIRLGQKGRVKLEPCQAKCDATVGCNFISVSSAWCKLWATCKTATIKHHTVIWNVYQRIASNA